MLSVTLLSFCLWFSLLFVEHDPTNAVPLRKTTNPTSWLRLPSKSWLHPTVTFNSFKLLETCTSQAPLPLFGILLDKINDHMLPRLLKSAPVVSFMVLFNYTVEGWGGKRDRQREGEREREIEYCLGAEHSHSDGMTAKGVEDVGRASEVENRLLWT